MKPGPTLRALAAACLLGGLLVSGCQDDRSTILISCGGSVAGLIPGRPAPIDIRIHSEENAATAGAFVVRRGQAGDAVTSRRGANEGGIAVQIGEGGGVASCVVRPTGRFRLNLGPQHPREIRVAGDRPVRVKVTHGRRALAEGRFDPERDEELTLSW